jgi:ribosome-associated toxin RatA of RatAB toxin-antitoxin module
MYHTILIISLLLAFSHAIAVADAERNWHALSQGEVLVETIEKSAGFPGLRAMFVVPASRERIWDVLLDYEHFPEIFAGIDNLQVLAQDAQGATIEFWVDAVLQKYHYVVYRHYEKPGWRLTWRRLSGDLRRLEGSWEIRDTPQRGVHLLVYESYVQVGGMVPMSLVRWSAMRKAREMGQRLRQWIARLPAGK